jgi:preprotein translocase subunit SecE
MSKAQSAVRRQPNVVVRLFRETTGELRKVSWPTRDEATRLTVIVLGVLAVMAALLGSLDFLFSKLIAMIIGIGA